MSEWATGTLDAIRKALPQAGVELRTNPGPSGQHSLLVAGRDLLAVGTILREQLGFDLLSNVTGVDWPDATLADQVAALPVPEEASEPSGEQTEDAPAKSGEEQRSEGFLEVVYHLYDTAKRIGPLVLRCRTVNRSDQVEVPSLVPVWRSAEFQEREIYDLHGVVFSGHPDLRRILMWDEFEDHPMRRDYVAPDDYEYEPTPHDAVLEKAKRHHAQ